MFRRECAYVTHRLWDHATGRLAESEARRVDAHLAECAGCREESESYKAVTRTVAAYRQQPVPGSSDNWECLRARLETAPARPGGRSRVPASVWNGMVFAAIALASLMVYEGSSLSRGSGSLFMLKGLQIDWPYSHAQTDQNAKPAPTVEPAQAATGDSASTQSRILTTQAISPPRRPDSGDRIEQPASEPSASFVDYAGIDGAATPSGARKDYVIGPAAYSDNTDSAKHYVMGSVPAGGAHVSTASQESPVW